MCSMQQAPGMLCSCSQVLPPLVDLKSPAYRLPAKIVLSTAKLGEKATDWTPIPLRLVGAQFAPASVERKTPSVLTMRPSYLVCFGLLVSALSVPMITVWSRPYAGEIAIALVKTVTP